MFFFKSIECLGGGRESHQTPASSSQAKPQKAKPLQDNLSKITEDLFVHITSYLPKEDVKRLICTSKNLEKITIKSFEINTLHSVRSMSEALERLIPQEKLIQFQNELMDSSLILQQESKLEYVQNLKINRFPVSTKSAKSVYSRLQKIEQVFMESFSKLWVLTREHITVKEFRKQEGLFNSKSPNCRINFASLSSLSTECKPYFDLLEKIDYDSLAEVEKLLNEHGSRYFPLIEQFLYNMPSDKFRGLCHYFILLPLCECLLKEDRLTEALDFVNKLTRKHYPNNMLNTSNIPLYGEIINFYDGKQDLFGAIRAIKIISKDFKLASMQYLHKVILLAFIKSDKQGVLDILDFFQVASLDPSSIEASIIKDQLKLAINWRLALNSYTNSEMLQCITNTISFIDVFPEGEMRVIILETICQYLLNQKEYRELLETSLVDDIKFNMERNAKETEEHKKSNEIILQRQNEKYFMFSNFVMVMAFDLFKNISDWKKTEYADGFIQLCIRKKNYSMALEAVKLVSNKEKRYELERKINESKDSELGIFDKIAKFFS